MADDGMESEVCFQTPPVPRYFLILSDPIEATEVYLISPLLSRQGSLAPAFYYQGDH